MASVCLREELSCSICLSLYTDPVSLRCGHNFCQDCIVRVLDTQEGDGEYSCPECRAEYQERPALEKNRKLSNIVESFLCSHPELEETQIFCTYCVDTPIPAVKQCLQCEMSLCEGHLTAHNKSVDHVLIDPTSSLTNRKCQIHKKLFEYHCCEDAACVCVYCVAIGSHKGHEVESLDEAMKTKQKKLRNLLGKLTVIRAEAEEHVQSLQDRRTEVEEKAAVVTGKVTDLFMDIRKKLDVLEGRVLSEVSRQTERISLQISDLIRQLEEQKDELSRRMGHIEELCNATDPLTVLQDRESDSNEKESDTESDAKMTYPVDDLDECLISVNLHSGLSDILTAAKRASCIPETADMLLDINTANNYISVSGDLKSASSSNVELNYPQRTMRFTDYRVVLSSTIFGPGQHCWEVGVSTSKYWRVGVAYSSMEREGKQSVIGDNSKSWCLRMSDTGYSVNHNSVRTYLQLQSPVQVIRLYLDYEAGRLSFYQLCDPIRHLHTFSDTFTKPLHAAFLVSSGGWVRINS
ncbi:E3 ubiquitin/ISG15 ligase TRIM25-like [Pseudophryne corroboree]|uniref:E3 ubiquitin/ISG15 ligase TRIM25-like n=1 Tax=Pseudophryne corroboree TaxID=495146 RepID=UPI003081D059